MIRVSDMLKAELRSASFTAVTCLQITFSSSDILRVTDGPRDITIDGRTYLATAQLHAISAPQAHTDVDRDNYTVSFLDADHSMRDKFAGSSGIPLEVGVTFLSDSGSPTSLLDGYRGFSSSIESRESNGTLITTVSFTGQLAQLDSNSPRLTTERSQGVVSTTDTAFKYVHDAAYQSSIKWGKK